MEPTTRETPLGMQVTWQVTCCDVHVMLWYNLTWKPLRFFKLLFMGWSLDQSQNRIHTSFRRCHIPAQHKPVTSDRPSDPADSTADHWKQGLCPFPATDSCACLVVAEKACDKLEPSRERK